MRLIIGLLLLSIFFSCTAQQKQGREVISASSTSDAYQPSRAAATALIEQHMRAMKIPGMQVAVSINGKRTWSGNFGYADLEAKKPVTDATTFRLGSVSKVITGAALALLVQQGKIHLDSFVHSYLPSFPKKQWPITIRQLATYSSGIRHYTSMEEANSDKNYASVTESLQQFASDPLLFEPGTQVEYSSYGYTLLSAVIEAVSKKQFPELLQEIIFRPLKMNRTSLEDTKRADPDQSQFYVMNGKDERVVAPFVDNSNKWAAGGMLSTANDLLELGNELCSGPLFHPGIRELVFSPAKLKNGEETIYGIGWEIRKDFAGRIYFTMDGSLPSTRSVVMIYPQEKLVMAILANTGNSILFNRQEALILSDLFLSREGYHPSAKEIDYAKGSYTYSTFFDEDSITGKINIDELNGKLQATMTVPNRFFKQRIIAVPVVRVQGDTIHLVGLPGNWISMSLYPKGKTVTGNWRFGPMTGELGGVRN